MNPLQKLFPNFSLKTLVTTLLSTAAISTIAYAAPTAPPGSTGYTLNDLYNRIVDGIEATPGSGSFTPSGAPAPTMRTLTEIYEAIPEPPKYFGQVGLPESYVDNGDGTITDNNTGLMWKKCTEVRTGSDCAGGVVRVINWSSVRNYCENLVFAGYDDWYLPNINELRTIANRYVGTPTINTEYFPNTPSSNFWSSTVSVQQNESRWSINFGYGTVSRISGAVNNVVRCVRQG